LAVVNPCGFPLLPAFLSFYLGADERRLPRAPTRAVQGLVVGALVAVGFIGFFALVGLPVSFGLGAVADAVPWVGLATGALLALTGLFVLVRGHVSVPIRLHVGVRRERRVGAMLLFGAAYGAASLGCALPVFLALVGASAGPSQVAVFVAYAAGTAVVLMALAVGVACARYGMARAVRPALPYVGRLSGVLLTISGAYLVYYWARIEFGDSVTLADDPIVGFATRYSAQLQDFAARHGAPLLTLAAAVVALALAGRLRVRRRGTAGKLARR
jgi:cytochrome c biogenesis protein CcdA